MATTLLNYAAYGSNLHPERLARRIPSARLLGTAFVDGWSIAFHKRGKDGSGKATLVREGRGAHVAVYSLSAADKSSLDAIEHAGVGYRETSLHVDGHGECFTYVANPTHVDATLKPFCWYRALVIAGARLHGFPRAYVDALEALPTQRDPVNERHDDNWSLAHALGAR